MMVRVLKFFNVFRQSAHQVPLSLLLILEIIAVVLGVAIGFLLNDWRDNARNRDIAQNAMNALAKEMDFNHQQIEMSYDYYKRFIETLDSFNISAKGDTTIYNTYGYQLPGWQGANPPQLRSSAYQMMLYSGVMKDIPFEDANTLAQIYAIQEVVETLNRAHIEKAHSEQDFTRLDKIYHRFQLYNEILPGLIGMYHDLGIPILGEHGYHREIEGEALSKAIQFQWENY